MKVLVLGGTGMLGRPVVERLCADGRQVRVMSRRPEAARGLFGEAVEIVAGDASDAHRLDAALDGVDAVHMSLRGTNTLASYERNELGVVRQVADRAHGAGVKRLSYVSGAGRLSQFTHLPIIKLKVAAEDALKSVRTPYTIFRPTHFMESLPLFIRGGRATIIGDQPHALHYLAASDFAAMVSRALGEPDAEAHTFTVHGPEAYTMREALEIYVRWCAPGTPIGTAPPPILRAVAAVTFNRDLSFATRLFETFREVGEAGYAAPANALLGAPKTSLEGWCRARCGGPANDQ
ncbi:MAG: NAD(P)H-binding protein [Oceanicaulis sp.]